MMERAAAPDVAALVRAIGSQAHKWLQRSGGNHGALLAGFASDRDAPPDVRDAVAEAYRLLATRLQVALRNDGHTPKQAEHRAYLVLALLEGGGDMAAICARPESFEQAVQAAARLCLITDEALPPARRHNRP